MSSGIAPVENPFQDTLRFGPRVPELAMVIFGANGDLAKRKLLPALYRLSLDRRLPPGFAVLGTSRTRMNDEQFRQMMRNAVIEHLENSPFDNGVWQAFAQGLFYLAGELRDPASYQAMARRLGEIDAMRHTSGNVIFYLSTQPSHYEVAAEGLGHAGLARAAGWRRLVVEKPFGHDTQSACKLSRTLQEFFSEDEIYRIDHYLGKETVQNILAFRFGNGIFEPLWNRRYVNHVQITAAESIGVEGRGAYYQESGALRDMIQNHMLQVMATVAMEPSATYDAKAVRDERAKLLRSIRIMRPGEVEANAVAGQYGPGHMGGADLPGFRQEPGVSPNSQTETFAAAAFFIENWRWAGVPFFIRTGKRLPKRATEIAIEFHAAPHLLFDGDGIPAAPNLLILRIQPDEGISLRFLSKQPGAGTVLRPVSMDFRYGSSFGERTPTAYETLLLDVMQGDPTLYTRQDMVEASWRVVQPILDHWANRAFDFPNYPAGTWGPSAADAMLARLGRVWRQP